ISRWTLTKEGFDCLTFHVSRTLFQKYISNEGSDYIVELILNRKEDLLQYNPKGAANGAARRKAAADEVVKVFDDRHPGLNKTFEQLKKNFDKRRDALKKALIMEKAYTSATGGGRDPKIESDIKKLQHPSMADSMLISYLRKTEGAMGVRDITLETGHRFGSIKGRMASLDEDMEEELDVNDNESPCTSRPVIKATSKKLTDAGIERAKKLSHVEFLKANRTQMLKRAADLGFRKGDGPVEKKEKAEGRVDHTISRVVTMVEAIEAKMTVSSGKAQAAIEAVEQLRAAIRYAPDRPISDLQSLLDDYVRASFPSDNLEKRAL
ncbi:hypothetical protein PRIPAC_79982, partial [Pristionchus pacificus]|uniref:Uncharacterized protein n=1 Tax=Pristionchus pacificus TaxID=54126 RepID=A0A2A6CPU8_PRIPA